MFDYSKTNRENLIRNFVAKTLDDEVPDNKCFTVCYILSVYLSIYNIPHLIKSGNVMTATKNIGHYIITFKNNEGEIDPTAQQIDTTNPQVLIQEKLYIDSTFIEIEFDKTYEDWEYLLLHDGFKKPFPPEVLQNLTPQMLEIENQKIDIIPYLRILIKAYYIFKEEIFELECKGQQAHQEFVSQFFEKTNNIAIQNKDKKGKLGSTSVNNKFDLLLDN